jgi:hypothetical protein
MRKIWWTWDIRMRWAHGFSGDPEAFAANYRSAIDAAGRYGVEGIVIWGFLRERHGGVDAAKRVCEHAAARGVRILPGVGVDAYGGVFYEGDSPHSLDTYLRAHPEAVARTADGRPFTVRWPATDRTERLVGCPSHEPLMEFYRRSLDWLLDTFDLAGFQIEQGDVGLCRCDRCRSRPRTAVAKMPRTCLEDMAARVGPLVCHALGRRPDAMVLVENYSGLLAADAELVGPFLADFPDAAYHSWQAYDQGRFFIDEGSRSPAPHGCIALRSNNDLFGGELDDRDNLRRAIALARGAGLDMTYLYGEYPDAWPTTRANYEAWAEAAG